MKVIDISDWQEGIDFDNIVNAGVEGVVIKAFEGQNPTSCFEDFKNECISHGLKWGLYLYTNAYTTDDARNEAHAVINLLNGEVPELGIWYDIEDDPESFSHPIPWLTGIPDPTGRASAFISELNAAGYSAGIYAGYYTLRDYIATDELADYVPIWYVQYSNSCDFAEVCSNLRMVAWQYTDNGRIDGWDYGIDFDEWYE